MFTDCDYNFAKELQMPSPEQLAKELPVLPTQRAAILQARQSIADILSGKDRRLLLVVGPCSVHHPEPVLKYAEELNELRLKYAKQLFIVMRCYVEKSRTGNTWPGFALDPDLNGSFDCIRGIYESRKLMCKIAELGLPLGMEFVFPNISRYFIGLLSWGCVGARSVEAPDLRFFASGLNMPVGVKNSMTGDVEVALRAMQVMEKPQFAFLGKEAGITTGNANAHLVLRGSSVAGHSPSAEKIKSFADLQENIGLHNGIVVDCSHGNALAADGQCKALRAIIKMYPHIKDFVSGIMLESFLESGRFVPDSDNIRRGCSITDSCLGLEETKVLLAEICECL